MCEFNSQGIDYIYNHGRLTDITAPHSGSVHYDYDAVGRIAKRWDASGTEEFTYDALGNVIGSTRRMAVPTESNVYVFHTGYKYDSYGRMLRITYPDMETVEYHYGAGGLLADMVSSIYDTICIRQYDERGQRVYQKYGNGTETFYQYSSDRNWLTDLFIQNSSYQFSEKHYTFDPVGNVSSITADEGPSASIASWTAYYTYDNRNRLVSGTGPYTYTVTHSPTGKLFRKSFDNLPSSSVSTPTGLIYGYDQDSLTHQPRVLYDTVSQSALELFWDADGNLAEMLDCDRDWIRMHRWNDFDRLTLSLGHDFCGYYGYDAEGIRTYKLTGTCKMDDVNGGDIGAQAIFDDMVLYPSPFVVVTPRGYTNHYYAGSERIASRIGNLCWLHDPFVSYEKPSPEWTALEEFQNLPNENYPFGRTDDWSDVVKNTTPIQDFLEKVQYPCPPVDLKQLNVLYSEDMLHDVMDCKTPTTNIVPVYYYHPDHLGSTSWVTDEAGNDFHFLAYMPYGDPFMDKHPAPYDTRYGQDFARYQFTGKERDAETGYDYIEQRYYWWPGGFWLRPDPLLDKYIHLSPYAYCNGNPLKYVDPEGGWVQMAVGALVSAGADVAVQVGFSMFVDHKSFSESLKNIDVKSVIGSAAAGAIGVGVVAKVSQAAKIYKLGKTGSALATRLASSAGDALGSVASQEISNGEVSSEEVRDAVLIGIVGNSAGSVVKSQLKNSQAYKQAVNQLDHAERVASGSSRTSRVNAVNTAQEKVDNYGRLGSQAVTSGISSVGTKAKQEINKRTQDVDAR